MWTPGSDVSESSWSIRTPESNEYEMNTSRKGQAESEAEAALRAEQPFEETDDESIE